MYLPEDEDKNYSRHLPEDGDNDCNRHLQKDENNIYNRHFPRETPHTKHKINSVTVTVQ
jgi:hypothetical protein